MILCKILRTRLSLFVSVYFYWYPHTYKILLPVKTINFLFFTGTIGITKLCCRLPPSFFYLIDVPIKQKTPFYFIQCNIQGSFGINLNKFSVSQMQHLHVELSINFRISNLKTPGTANFKIIVAGTGILATAYKFCCNNVMCVYIYIYILFPA